MIETNDADLVHDDDYDVDCSILAEGNGRRSWKEKNRFFDISIASIDEVDAACDLLVAFQLVSILVIGPVQRDLRIAAAMIMKLRRP